MYVCDKCTSKTSIHEVVGNGATYHFHLWRHTVTCNVAGH